MDKIENDENQNLIDDHEEATTGMDEISNFDFERAMMLMSVLEKCSTIGVKSTSIAGLASAALNEMNEEAKVLAKKRAEAVKELERKRDEAIAAQARQRDEEARVKAEEEAKAKAERVKQPAPPEPTVVDPPARPTSRTSAVAENNARRV